MSHTNVYMTLTGKQNVTFDFCAAVATALGEPALKLFQLAGLMPVVPPLEDRTLRELSETMRDMTLEERDQIIDYARWLRRRNRSQT